MGLRSHTQSLSMYGSAVAVRYCAVVKGANLLQNSAVPCYQQVNLYSSFNIIKSSVKAMVAEEAQQQENTSATKPHTGS